MSAVAISPRVDVEFVRMNDADLDAVVAIEQRIHAFPWTRGNFTDCLKSGYAAWLLRVRGELAGYAIVTMALDEVQLLNIGIATPLQRAGYGGHFMSFLFDEAYRAGALRMFLEVRESNVAGRALYQRCGFVQVGERRNYYPTRDGREAALVLAKDFLA